jgi:hypothetical protein
MQVTLSLMTNDNVNQDPINIHRANELVLDFQVDGCFCPDKPDDFAPPLPKGFCAEGSHPRPYKPVIGNHDTHYTWDTSQACTCPKDGHHIIMHTIHTGN